MTVPFLQDSTFTGLVSTQRHYTSREWSQAFDVATFYTQNSATQVLVIDVTYNELINLRNSNLLIRGQRYRISDFQLKWWNQSINENIVLTSPVVEPLLTFALGGSSIAPEVYSPLYPQDILFYDPDATSSVTWGNLNPGPIPDFKGWILQRIDTINNIDLGWDWRHITNNCCKFNFDNILEYNEFILYNKYNVVKSSIGKLYYSIISNNIGNSLTNTTAWLPMTNFVEQDVYFPTDEFLYGGINNDLITTFPIISTRIQQTTFPESLTALSIEPRIQNCRDIKIASGHNNVIISNGFNNNNIGSNFNYNIVQQLFENNIIGSNCINNIFGEIFKSNIIANNFQNNTICSTLFNINGFEFNSIKNAFINNIISGEFRFNTLGNTFQNNKIGAFANNNILEDNFFNNDILNSFSNNQSDTSFQGNIINNNFLFNVVGDLFAVNNINDNFTYNLIESNFIFNTIGSNYKYNTIGNEFEFNIIGDDMFSNIIGNICKSNTIEDTFTNNEIQNNFVSNTIGSNFNSNTIKNNINNINFLTSTHVYNSYDTTIFRNSNNIIRLSYFNENDQLVVTDPEL
jgi:hypothetical protein